MTTGKRQLLKGPGGFKTVDIYISTCFHLLRQATDTVV